MSKTRHLDQAINILRRAKVAHNDADMRPVYEKALYAEGWRMRDNANHCSEWYRGNNRMIVYNGDRVAISFGRDPRWHFLNATARQRLLLPSQ